MRRLVLLTAAVLVLAGCTGSPAPTGSSGTPVPGVSRAPAEPLRYVALGESYTIGEGLSRRIDRWPNQLVRAVAPDVRLSLVDNLARPSHGTLEVIEVQLPDLETLAPDVVSLLIGVNDVFVNLTDQEYRDNLVVILDGRPSGPGTSAVTGILDLVPAERVILVTTPDYTLTPRGPTYQRPQDRDTIARFNAILKEEAASRGITVVDIAPISDLVSRDPTLVADDGLHPSAKQFAGWVELIAPVVRRQLGIA